MLSYAFPPIASSGTFRVARFAKYLPQFGWHPIVVSPRPEHAIYNEVDPSLERLVPQDLISERTTVLRPFVQTRKHLSPPSNWPLSRRSKKRNDRSLQPQTSRNPLPHKVRPLRDLLNTFVKTPDRHSGWILPAVKVSRPLIRKYRPRAIFSSGPPHSAHLVAMILQRLTGLPIICDLRDPWARNPWRITGPLFQDRAQSMLERFCVSRADTIILNTQNTLNEFESFYEGQNHGKFTVISNGYDPDLVPSQTCSGEPNNISLTDSAVRLCHCGSVYGNRSLLPLVQAIGKLKSSGNRFELNQVGKVAAERELIQVINEHDLDQHVLLDGQLSHQQALKRMSEANILVVIQGGTEMQVPAKLFEMMPFRKPILALAGPGPTAEIVRQYELGVVIDPNDVDAVAAAILRLAANPSIDKESPGLQRALRDFDGSRLTSRLADVLRLCIGDT